MKLIPLKCPHLKNAKNIIPHPNYLFVLTGKAIIILDRNFEHIKTVEGLKYAYRGSLSPDQTKLLVTSNDNMFYILSLESLEITYRCSIKGGVVGIEGGGCWSPDGNSVIMIVMNKKSCVFAIRTYPLDTPNTFSEDDSIGRAYRFFDIISISKLNSVYILAQSRANDYTNFEPCAVCILQLKDGQIKKHELERNCSEGVFIEYNELMNRFVIYTQKAPITCDLNGKNLREVDIGIDEFEFNKDAFRFWVPLVIKKIIESKNQKYVFLASNAGLDIFDAKTGNTLISKDFAYGSTNIVELEENLIVVSMFGGSSKMYKIED